MLDEKSVIFRRYKKALVYIVVDIQEGYWGKTSESDMRGNLENFAAFDV